MARQPNVGVGRRGTFDRFIIGADDGNILIGNPLGCLDCHAWTVAEHSGAIRPEPHSARPKKNDIALPNFHTLTLSGLLAILDADPIGLGQTFGTFRSGNIEEHATSNNGRNLLAASLLPMAAAEVLVRIEAVVHFTTVAEMIGGIA